MLSKTLRLELKRRAHHLDPVILVGQHGITENLINETARALDDHELIKIKIAHHDRLIRQTYANQLIDNLKAELIHSIGKMVILYRKKATEEHNKTIVSPLKHSTKSKRKKP